MDIKKVGRVLDFTIRVLILVLAIILAVIGVLLVTKTIGPVEVLDLSQVVGLLAIIAAWIVLHTPMSHREEEEDG